MDEETKQEMRLKQVASETSVNFQRTIGLYIPENITPHSE
jgi:hypothetical protein